MQRVIRAHRAHGVYVKYRESLDDSDDDDGPEDDDAWLFEDLKVLTQLYSRLRDREQIIALIFEVGVLISFLLVGSVTKKSRQGVTAELLKDILTIFYAPLAQVYRAASIGDSLSDMQSFINDLIKTVEAVEEREKHSFISRVIFLMMFWNSHSRRSTEDSSDLYRFNPAARTSVL